MNTRDFIHQKLADQLNRLAEKRRVDELWERSKPLFYSVGIFICAVILWSIS